MGPAVAAGLMVGLILLAVALRVGTSRLTGQWGRGEASASDQLEVQGFTPAPTITDRNGRILAMSVPVFTLSLSPQSMWRSHTPDFMSGAILAILEDLEVEDLSAAEVRQFLGRLLEHDDHAPAGEPRVLTVQDPKLLRFEGPQARVVRDWIERGALEGQAARGALRGIRLVELAGDGAWTIQWTPEFLLSRSLREEHLGKGTSARYWVDHLLDDLTTLVGPDIVHEHLRLRVGDEWSSLAASQVRVRSRDALWSELLDCQYRVAKKFIDAIHAQELRSMFSEQAVSGWQMKLVMRAKRTYALRSSDYKPSPFVLVPPMVGHDPISVLGHWGRMDSLAAKARAERMLEAQPGRLNWNSLGDPRRDLVDRLVNEPRPMSGLELLVRDYLDRESWAQVRASTMQAGLRVLPRDRRNMWANLGRAIPSDLLSAQGGSFPVEVEATLDAPLQMYLHQQLTETVTRQGAVLAMGIVLDTASGEVLAVDAVHAYRISGWAPLQHVFTPGSTAKAITMAAALDRGVVQPDDLFKTFADQGGIQLGSRHISEARGAPKEAEISASVALARSVNAVMVQIGALVPAPVLREYLHSLGLGQRPGVGLGPEAPGYLPALDSKNSWSPHFTHASVSMGHELSVSLWQMASALATVVRGGEQLPLRLVRAIRQGPAKGIGFVAPEGVRVLGQEACDPVRDMMEMGAREGTGKTVTAGHWDDFDLLLSKTGTAQRVSTEGCLHDEHRVLEAAAAEGRSLTRAERAQLRGSRNAGHRDCYTSSICLVGRVEGRELMTFIVVEDPFVASESGGRKPYSYFGSRVAGPPAMRLLRLAMGLSPELDGAQVVGQSALSGPAVQPRASVRPGPSEVSEQPWMESGR
jgi:cell division protein FtsI/penicillin-binding protein 2